MVHVQNPCMCLGCAEVCGFVVQVLIRWAIQNGTSVIPKATGVSHIKGNLEALDFELTKEEFQVNLLQRPHALLA